MKLSPRRWLLIAVAAVAALALTFALTRSPEVTAEHAGDFPSLGNPDAKVVITEFSDFQCPFCGRYARETLPQIITKYVDSGQVRIEWRHFTAFGAESVRAAAASEAAHQQDRFWDYHELLFVEQKPMNSGALGEQQLIGYAQRLDLDVAAFEEALRSEAVAERVSADLDAGINLGVRGTPAFLINGRMLAGAQPFEIFEQVIDEALATAK